MAYGRWQSAGLSDKDGARLDQEVENLAGKLAAQGVRGPWDGTERWAKAVTETFYQKPKTLPPAPEEPWSNPYAFAFLTVPLVVVSAIIWVPNQKNGSVLVVLGVVWIAYVIAWVASVQANNNHSVAVDRHWAKHDPNRGNRRRLREELSSALETVLAHKADQFDRPAATIPAATVAEQPRPGLGWTPLAARPEPMSSCTDRQAEFLAMRWMQYLGAEGCRVSGATRDGGADVIARHYVAEVKHHAAPVSPAFVRQIFGVATAERKKALFFSLSGYSDEAVRFAEQAGVALFAYDFQQGVLRAKSATAHQALKSGLALTSV